MPQDSTTEAPQEGSCGTGAGRQGNSGICRYVVLLKQFSKTSLLAADRLEQCKTPLLPLPLLQSHKSIINIHYNILLAVKGKDLSCYVLSI